ncbi:inositol monophosphatase family protein [Nitrincola sp. MINF-07-Sa-05]|uniref:inositol monophosphatase family protein n=1 Tax=Nitrincola salilacus TaxID=3400273 RepID=UPI0039185A65
MQPMVNIALRAARLAGEQLSRAVERLDLIKPEQSSVAEFINDTCIQVERTIVHNIHKAYPHHTLNGEYTGRHEGTGEGPSTCEWQISPVDSLTNFSNALPMFALSLTGRVNGKLEHTVVINPITAEEFTASRGSGAQLNGRRLRVSNQKAVQGTLIGTGFFGRNSDREQFEQHQAMVREIISAGGNTFISGSPVLNLAYTAAGRLDGFFQLGLTSAEQDAGILLIQEAGGLVGDFNGGSSHQKSGNLVAGSPKMFKALLKSLQPVVKLHP